MILIESIIDNSNILTHLKIVSDLFTNINVTTPYKMTVNVKRNCCGDYSLEMTDNSLFIGDVETGMNYIELDAEFFSSADENVPDGVYYFEIIVENTITGEKTKQRSCFFNGHLLKCLLIDYIANHPTDCKVFQFYQALTFINNCSDCNCENGCIIYNELLKLLTNNKNHDCGC
jgi:hypothetical protein